MEEHFGYGNNSDILFDNKKESSEKSTNNNENEYVEVEQDDSAKYSYYSWVAFLVFVLTMFCLFAGTPDLHDALVANLMPQQTTTVKTE